MPLNNLGLVYFRAHSAGHSSSQVLITFTNRELREMVEEPTKRVGLKYDDGVIDRLLLDVQGDPAAALVAAPVYPAAALE